jgi:hypothetical protein
MQAGTLKAKAIDLNGTTISSLEVLSHLHVKNITGGTGKYVYCDIPFSLNEDGGGDISDEVLLAGSAELLHAAYDASGQTPGWSELYYREVGGEILKIGTTADDDLPVIYRHISGNYYEIVGIVGVTSYTRPAIVDIEQKNVSTGVVFPTDVATQREYDDASTSTEIGCYIYVINIEINGFEPKYKVVIGDLPRYTDMADINANFTGPCAVGSALCLVGGGGIICMKEIQNGGHVNTSPALYYPDSGGILRVIGLVGDVTFTNPPKWSLPTDLNWTTVTGEDGKLTYHGLGADLEAEPVVGDWVYTRNYDSIMYPIGKLASLS